MKRELTGLLHTTVGQKGLEYSGKKGGVHELGQCAGAVMPIRRPNRAPIIRCHCRIKALGWVIKLPQVPMSLDAFGEMQSHPECATHHDLFVLDSLIPW